MKYSVIKLQGHQYKVSEGDKIVVDHLKKELKPEILLIVNEKSVKVGKPTVNKAKVSIKILEESKGEKITIFKYKAKSRYRKKRGFRAHQTQLLVEKFL